MSYSEEPGSFIDILNRFVVGTILGAAGVLMLIFPSLLDDYVAQGRRGMMKQILIYIWSTPGGIIIALLGLLIVGHAAAILMSKNKD